MSLHSHELDGLTRMLGQDISILASGIAKLYVANPSSLASKKNPNSAVRRFPGIKNGKFKQTNLLGALLLVLERSKQAFHFVMADPQSFTIIFKYELYYDIDYQELSSNFHSFEMDDLVAGFGFSSEEAAKQFFVKVNVMKPSKKNKTAASLLQEMSSAPPVSPKAAKPKGLVRRFFGSESNKSSGGMEVQFWNADGTLRIQHIPKAWKLLLEQAGFKKRDLKDPSMQTLIINCLEELGISTSPPPENVSSEQLAQYYSQHEMEQYQQYQEQLRLYQEEEERYMRELEAYESYQRQESGLQAWEHERNSVREAQQTSSPSSTMRRISLSLPATPRSPITKTTSPATPEPLSPNMSSSVASKPAPPPLPQRKGKPSPPPRPSKRRTVRPQLPVLPPLPEELYSESKSWVPSVMDQSEDDKSDGFGGSNYSGYSSNYSGNGRDEDSGPSVVPIALPLSRPTAPKTEPKRRSLMSRMFNRTTSTKRTTQRAPALGLQVAKNESAGQRPRSRLFLAGIRAGPGNLKQVRQSVLPDLRSIRKDTQASILDRLRAGLDERRQQIHDEEDDESNDSGSDWSDLD